MLGDNDTSECFGAYVKFLIYTQYFPPEVGAAQTRLAATARQLMAQGHEVEVVTAIPNYQAGAIFPEYKGKFYVCEEWEGCKVHRLWLYPGQGRGYRRILNYLSFLLVSLWGIFKADKPDWIFVNSGPLFLSIPAYVASRRWGVPFIFNVADLWPKSIKELGVIKNRLILKWLEALERWSYREAEVVVAVTEGIRSTLIGEKGVPSNKILFLPNGVDAEMFSPRPADEELIKKHDLENKKIFMYPGLHGYAHALDKVLDAAKLVQDRDDIQIMLIGSGSEKAKLLKKAEQEKIKNVTFVDPVSQKDLARYLSIAYCGLIHQKDTPLANETRPAKSFPIMAMAKPILFAGFGEGANLIQQKSAGQVIDPEQPELLAKTMIEWVDNPQRLKAWGENGRRFVLSELTWDIIVSSWLDELLPARSLPKEKKPLVSIIMPAYNADKFIGKSIESVKAQTYPNWELIVVDDCSRDKTVYVVNSYKSADSRIRLMQRRAQGGGPSKARNEGMSQARGRYIAFLDSDDLWLPTKVEKQVACMMRGGYDLTYTGFRRISEDGSKTGRLLPIPREISYEKLLKHNVIGTLTVMVDRRALYRLRMKELGHEDFILWLDILKSGKRAYGLIDDLARYRIVGTSVSANKLKAASWVWNIYRKVQRLPLPTAIWYFMNYLVRVTYKYSRF